MPGKSGIENVLSSSLSVFNAEQNFAYAPNVYSNHYNIITAFILDNLALIYPKFMDVGHPFIKSENIPVTKGNVILPKDFRNLLGSPSISVKVDGSDCSSIGESPDTKAEFETAKLTAGCKTRPVKIVDKSTWDYLTTSSYAYPTHNDPVGFFEGSKIKVCPYDLAYVKITYFKKEEIYRYGYIVQPDDTFIFDQATSVDSPWNEAAFELLFKGVVSLYAAYSRDGALAEYSQVLNKLGMF